jgi:hypothetical protein
VTKNKKSPKAVTEKKILGSPCKEVKKKNLTPNNDNKKKSTCAHGSASQRVQKITREAFGTT